MELFKTRRFSCCFWSRIEFSGYGCGITALATLTPRVNPAACKYSRLKRNFTTPAMGWALVQEGFAVLPVMLSATGTRYSNAHYVTPEHVLVVRSRMNEKESSWSVVWDDMAVHNFTPEPLKPLSFINSPVLDSFVVAHPDWYRNDHTLQNEAQLMFVIFLNSVQCKVPYLEHVSYLDRLGQIAKELEALILRGDTPTDPLFDLQMVDDVIKSHQEFSAKAPRPYHLSRDDFRKRMKTLLGRMHPKNEKTFPTATEK